MKTGLMERGQDETDRLGAALAAARIGNGMARETDLRGLSSLDEAVALREAADCAYGSEAIGYTLAGTSAPVARQLRCDDPIVGTLFAWNRVKSGATLTTGACMLGVGPEFAFVFGRCFPENDFDRDHPGTIVDAIAACHIGLQVLARRVRHPVPLNHWTASADFGLAHTNVDGPVLHNFRDRLLPDSPVRLCLDGHPVLSGTAADVMGHPLVALRWLADETVRRGLCIDAGDVVTTGSVTGLAQMIPGRTVTGDFGSFGTVELRLR